MKRSDSLALLHTWAAYPAIARMDLPRMVAETESHGLAAVRAIRSVTFGACRLNVTECFYAIPEPATEARLAFRSALKACGFPSNTL